LSAMRSIYVKSIPFGLLRQRDGGPQRRCEKDRPDFATKETANNDQINQTSPGLCLADGGTRSEPNVVAHHEALVRGRKCPVVWAEPKSALSEHRVPLDRRFGNPFTKFDSAKWLVLTG
jgi:hypothetical protein